MTIWARANTFASISTNPLSLEHCWSSFNTSEAAASVYHPSSLTSSSGLLTACGAALVHLLPLFPLLYLLCLVCFIWSWSGGSSKGAIFCFLSYSPLDPSGVSQVHGSSSSCAKCRSVGLFHFWVSKGSTGHSSLNLLLSPPCNKSQTIYLTAFLHWCLDCSLPLEFSALLHSIILLLATWLEMQPSSLILLLWISCAISNWLSNSISFTYKRLLVP